jgi:hypothetical protein
MYIAKIHTRTCRIRFTKSGCLTASRQITTQREDRAEVNPTHTQNNIRESMRPRAADPTCCVGHAARFAYQHRYYDSPYRLLWASNTTALVGIRLLVSPNSSMRRWIAGPAQEALRLTWRQGLAWLALGAAPKHPSTLNRRTTTSGTAKSPRPVFKPQCRYLVRYPSLVLMAINP